MPSVKMVYLLFSIYFLTSAAVLANQNVPEVKIDQGVLRGKYRQTWRGRSFSSFSGIPYAKPPVGELRFKPPAPAEPWEGILDASKLSPECPQIDVYVSDYTVRGTEDCLFLNIYTPQLTDFNSTRLPVMFFIHGGGFMCGSGNPLFYGPDILLDKNVVLVTINYRLGALGFLSTGDEVVPGNNGFKDQNFALKWVKRNIANFGGDPEKITLFGQSAGGASTHYHLLSPLSKDLIKGAIAQSGLVLVPLSFAPISRAVGNAKRLAGFLNCSTITHQEMIECLRKVDAYNIVAQDTKFMEWSYDPHIPFKPVAEPDLEGAFIAEDPIDIIKSGKIANVPFITGITTEDGAIRSAGLYNYSNLIDDLNKKFERVAPIVFQYDESVSNKDDLSKRIRGFYFGNREIDGSQKSELSNVFTDTWFLSPLFSTVKLHAKYSKQPVYSYVFGYRGEHSLAELFGDSSYDYGVCHGDELFYLMSQEIFGELNEADKKMIDVMTTIWTNFAATGNPTPEIDTLIHTKWEPVQSDSLKYYFIKDQNDISMSQNEEYMKRARFWQNLPTDPRYNKIRDEL